MKIYAWLAISVISVSTTCHNKDIQCTNIGANVGITGFDSTEIERITTYKYPQNGQFATILDSAMIELRFGFQQTDTIYHAADLDPGFDYLVTTVPMNRIWRISNLSFYQTVRRDDGTGSFRCGIASYTVNGALFNYPEADNQQNRIVLRR